MMSSELKNKTAKNKTVFWAALGLAAFLPHAARAQATAAQSATAAQNAATDSVLQELDQKIRILERKLEVKDEEDQKKASETPVVTAGKDGFSIKSADGESVLKLKFFSHVDGRYYIEDSTDRKLSNTLLLRRVRPIWEGTLFKYYNFRVMPEFAGTLQILDAYSEIAYWPQARLRVGKSKTPFGLERIKSSQDMDLPEFALPTSLTPNYDVGVSLLGDFFDEALSYYGGVFNGAVDGTSRDVDNADDKDLIGRVFALPFKNGSVEALRNFGIGFAASFGRKEGDFTNTELPVYKTEGQQTFFSFRTLADKAGTAAVPASGSSPAKPAVPAVIGDSGTVRAAGTGYRLNPQAYLYFGSFGLFGEYVRSVQEASKGGAAWNVSEAGASAWQATVSYVLTGESPSFKGLKPRHAVALGQPGLGALELVARVSQLTVDDDVFPRFADPAKSAREALTWGGGFNWYLSRAVKWSTAFSLTQFQGGAAAGADRADERLVVSRIQTAF
jgi:phosphate-selective porin OprO/OprP